MAALTNEQKVLIVKGLACFMSPTEVTELVKEEFGITIDRQQVRHYNPEQNSKVGAEWKKLFDEERERFKKDIDSIGIAHQAYRLRRLDTMERKAYGMRNYALAAQLHEQAAKETGGGYTNRKEITGKDGGEIEVKITPIDTDYRNAVQPLAPQEGG